MPRRRLELFERLARVRRVHTLSAAIQVADAQAEHRKLQLLHERSRAVATGLDGGAGATDGAALARRIAFVGGVQAICHETASQSMKAQSAAEAAIAGLRSAELLHRAASEQVQAQQSRVEAARDARGAAHLARNLKSR